MTDLVVNTGKTSHRFRAKALDARALAAADRILDSLEQLAVDLPAPDALCLRCFTVEARRDPALLQVFLVALSYSADTARFPLRSITRKHLEAFTEELEILEAYRDRVGDA